MSELLLERFGTTNLQALEGLDFLNTILQLLLTGIQIVKEKYDFQLEICCVDFCHFNTNFIKKRFGENKAD